MTDLDKDTAIAGGMLDRVGLGMMLADSAGSVLESNETAREMVSDAYGDWLPDATCCSLFGCFRQEPLAHHCISKLATASDEPLPELRIDMPVDRPAAAAWVTAAKAGDEAGNLLFHLRPAAPGDRRQRTSLHWMSEGRISVHVLGRTQVETLETKIEGDWLLRRPGHLLKYLICQRGRPAHVDEIVEALFPGSGANGRGSVRYFVHVLRGLLEPDRAPRATSSFIVSSNGTYSLGPSVSVDLDEFEALVSVGMRRNGPDDNGEGISLLEQAIDIYRGDLFLEEPFAEWAFTQREAARSLALRAVMTLVRRREETGESAEAMGYLERCASLWPVDIDVQRSLIRLYLEHGRRSDAQRRFEALRRRLREDFNREPGFKLAELESSVRR
jgi:DNA-binding SARP family transcriptional activator